MTDPVQSPARLPAWAHSLLAVLCLLPPVALALLLRRSAVNVPYWDEWDDDIAGLFLKWHAGVLTFGDFWAQHTESRLVLPHAIFLLLGNLSHWNLCWEMAGTFLLAVGAATMIFWLGRKTLSQQPLTAWLAGCLASVLIFSPTQYQAWLWGLELILYLPLVCLLASLLVWQTRWPQRTRFLACGALAIISTYSFSNGLLAWIALFPILFLAGGLVGLRQQRRAALLWLMAFLANVALYFQDYQFPATAGLWAVLRARPFAVVEYLLTFLGCPLVNQPDSAAVTSGCLLGGVQLALFAVVALMVFRARKNPGLMARVWPWLTLGGYGILSALLATVGRAAGGPAQALSPRYGIFGVCLTVSLIYLVPRVLLNTPALSTARRRVALAFLAALVLTLHALAVPAAVMNMTIAGLDRQLAKSSLRFLSVLPPQTATELYLCPNQAWAKLMAQALAQAGVWSFSLHPTRRLADFNPALAPADPIGSIEYAQVHGPDLLLFGWALAPSRRVAADAVVFTCEGPGVEPQIFGLIDQRLMRGDLAERLGNPAARFAGWQKKCPLTDLPHGALTLKAWAYEVETGQVTRLTGEARLDHR